MREALVHVCCDNAVPNQSTYDRGCRLHSYAIRREPWFFRDATFWIDLLHILNHIACAETYNPGVLRNPALHSSVIQHAHRNTQAAEQGNSTLALIKNCVSFMTQEHFMLAVRRFLAARNARKIAVMNKRAVPMQ